MARKKTSVVAVRTGMELVAPSSSELASFEGLFDPDLTAGAEGSGGLAPFIGTEDGIFKLKDNTIGRELECVILGVAVEHTLYAGRYVKGQPPNALCFYVGSSEDDGKPHETSPQAQSDTCATCIKNAFGSGQGNAKACRQSRRLLIMPLGPNDDATDAELYRLRIPPTSIKHLTSYSSLLRSYKRPLQSLVTKIVSKPHETNRFELKFTPHRALSTQQLAVIARRATEGKEALFALPMVKATKQNGGKAQTKGGRRVVRR